MQFYLVIDIFVWLLNFVKYLVTFCGILELVIYVKIYMMEDCKKQVVKPAQINKYKLHINADSYIHIYIYTHTHTHTQRDTISGISVPASECCYNCTFPIISFTVHS